jgi:acyl carrier protein
MSKITQLEVLAAMEKALGLKSGSIVENTSSSEIANWDSLGHLSVLVELDKLFDGKIAAIGEMADADSVEKIIVLLRQHSLI